jgi:cytidylate kinase
VKKIIVAIDGPAGAGKSTVAKRLAKELGYTYMDTGAMYRAFALKARREGIDLDNESALRASLAGTNVELMEKDGQPKVLLDGRDVTSEIRAPEMSQWASKISALKPVRERMVELQRALGARGGVVVEGRDIGTVVFPGAEVKIFLTAGTQERGLRRFAELQAHGKDVTLEETLGEMKQRDRRDQERAVAPLRQAEDAVAVDSTGMSVDQVVEKIMKEIKKSI